MAAALPVLVNGDLNRAKNKKASDEVIPFVYETVIAWGCPKTQDESFLEYYNRRPEKLWEDNKEEWENEVEEKLRTRDMTQCPEAKKEKVKEKTTKHLKEEKARKLLNKVTWEEKDIQHLNQKTCDGLDATFLHKLVPTICDGFGRCDPNAPASTEIKRFLREVKNIRNDICHDPKGASISNTILDDLEVSAVNVFLSALSLYSPALDKKTVQDKIGQMKERLRNIKTEMMTDKQQRILQTAKKMSVDGVAEMNAAIMLQGADFLPLSDDKVRRMEVFYSVDLWIKNDNEDNNKKAGTENNGNEKTNREIPSHKLLEHFKGSNVLCEGQPGTGKTTLLKTLREDFGAKSKERFCGVRKFDLLLYMECRNNSIKTVEQLLEHQFPETLLQLSKRDAVKALRKLKLLICVDGIDELTFHTKILLSELISKFGYSRNATFIFTSRPGLARSVSLSHETVTLQSIKGEDQQVEFLRRYQAGIKGFKDPALINAFKSLNETCKAVLRQPVYLALFCALFRKSPQVVEKLKSEVTFLNHFLSLSKQSVCDRIDAMGLANPECYAENVTSAILDLSLCLLLKDEMTLTAKTYTKMCRDVFQDAKVEYYPIMSTFFTKHPDQQTFEFYHQSHAEFLAAKAIAQRFVSNPAVSVVSTIQAICSERRHYFQYAEVHAELRSLPIYTVTAFLWAVARFGFSLLRDGTAPSPYVTDEEGVSLKRLDNVLRFVCMLIHEGGPPMQGALQRFLGEVCPALVKEEVGFDYWTDLVLGCPDSDMVAQVAANSAELRGKAWTVRTSRAMIAISKMLRYRQPPYLVIEPLRGEEDPEALAVLLEAVTKWHKSWLRLILRESYENNSPCDASLACLESAQCELDYLHGCLSGCNDPAWRALEVGVGKETGMKWYGAPVLHISLLNPMCHKLGQLDGTNHDLQIKARPPSSPDDRRQCPLPTSRMLDPELRVECRPAAESKAPVDGGAIAAFILDLASRGMKYFFVYLLHYPGTDGALDGVVVTLRARGVKTRDSSTRGWEEAEIKDGGGDCTACEVSSSSHRPGERCVKLSP